MTPDQDFSILALGRRLGSLRCETEKLDILTMKLGGEVPSAPMDARRLAQRHAQTARSSTEEHCRALEDLILSSRAEDGAGALVQVLVASCRLDIISQEPEPGFEQTRVEAALQSAARALANAVGVSLVGIGGRFYASTWLDRWPAVDTSGIEPGDPGHPDGCIDGSQPV